MYKEDIILSDIETVKNFVTFANKFDFPINLISERHVINGKSIMGIFSLDPYSYYRLKLMKAFLLNLKGNLKLLGWKKKTKYILLNFLKEERVNKNWYGQLMRVPQIMAYIIQIDCWMKKYKIDLI